MIDERSFSDSYDLYRPTSATSETGVQSRTVPTTATSSGNLCLFFPGAQALHVTSIAIRGEFDAVMLVPYSTDLKPFSAGDLPDEVEVLGERYTVLRVWDASGRMLFKVATLQQRKG